REQRPRKLLSRQLPKKVRLILIRISTTQQSITMRRLVKLDARVVTSRDFLAAETDRQLVQRSKLETAVAGNTGNRRFAIQVAVDERLHNVALEFLLQIQHVKRKSQFFGNAPCVINVIERAAARRQRL